MALTSISGTITTGGAAQTISAANVYRNGFWVQNNSSGDLWVNELGSAAAASQPAIKIAAGQLYESQKGEPCPYAISIFGATTGQAFTAREW